MHFKWSFYLHSENLVDKFKTMLGDRFNQFGLIHVNVVDLKNTDQVDMNRDVTMTYVTTRAKPNCFNNLHQVERKVLLTGQRSIMAQINRMTCSSLMSEFGLTQAEGMATLNLCVHIPEQVKQKLARIASTYGMWCGPIGHGFLGSVALRKLYGPHSEDDWWIQRMLNDDDTIMLMVERTIDDWKARQPGIRKTATHDAAVDMQKICRVFHIFMDELRQRVPAESYNAECGQLLSAFRLGVFDDTFKDIAADQPRPLKIEIVHEFACVLTRHESRISEREIQKRKDLKAHVENATWQSLVNDLESDLAKISEYNDSLISARALGT